MKRRKKKKQEKQIRRAQKAAEEMIIKAGGRKVGKNRFDMSRPVKDLKKERDGK